MTKVLEHSSKKNVSAAALDLNDILESVALALEGRGTEKLLGIEGVESRALQDLIDGPVEFNPIHAALTVQGMNFISEVQVDGTIFGAIADELEVLGLGKHETIGQTMTSLGVDMNDEEVARGRINTVGCWCNGEVIEARDVANRIRNLKK